MKTDFGKSVARHLAKGLLHQPASRKIHHPVVSEIGALEVPEGDLVQVDYPDDASRDHFTRDETDMRATDKA